MYRRFMLLLALCLIAVPLAACNTPGQIESQPVNKQADSTVQEKSAVAEATPELVVAEPAPAEGDFLLPAEGVRPISVMIDNEGAKCLPQGGLDKAQIIYELLVEGGETRLMPIFWGVDAEMIGPVRSARDYFLDYSMEHDAVFVHFGWSPQAKADLSKFKINNINGLYVGNDVIWELTKDKGNWQDSYTSMDKLTAYAKKMKYKVKTEAEFPFEYNKSDVSPAKGKAAEKISLVYSALYSCEYEYDNAAAVYKRLRKGKPQLERVSGKQLEAKNIIIQYTPSNSIKGDKLGRQEMNTTGSGKGYFITGGNAIKIKWVKESRRAQTKYTDEAGKEILLNRGQTWIQVIPTTAKVVIK